MIIVHNFSFPLRQRVIKSISAHILQGLRWKITLGEVHVELLSRNHLTGPYSKERDYRFHALSITRTLGENGKT